MHRTHQTEVNLSSLDSFQNVFSAKVGDITVAFQGKYKIV